MSDDDPGWDEPPEVQEAIDEEFDAWLAHLDEAAEWARYYLAQGEIDD